MRSIDIWKKTYDTSPIEDGLPTWLVGDMGSSGAGSKGNLLEFKVNFINNFIEKNNIKSVLDFGHGDLDVARYLLVKKYTGIDIFNPNLLDIPFGLNLINSKFDKYTDSGADLVICLDVIYHILEEEQDYMRKSLDKMIEKSDRFFIMYAHDSTDIRFETEYNGHLYNSKWIQYLNKKDNLKLIYEQEQPEEGCSAKFYVYEIESEKL